MIGRGPLPRGGGEQRLTCRPGGRRYRDGGAGAGGPHDSAWFDLGTIDSYNQGLAAFTAAPERLALGRRALV